MRSDTKSARYHLVLGQRLREVARILMSAEPVFDGVDTISLLGSLAESVLSLIHI